LINTMDPDDTPVVPHGTVCVTVDDRERGLMACLSRTDAAMCPRSTTKRLLLGDVLIHDSDGAVAFAIERKTVADLSASLRDGRFVDQRARLLETYGRERVVYVLEGTDAVWKMAPARGALMALHFRDRVQVLRTLDVEETAEAIVKLATLCKEGRADARGAPPCVEGPPARRLDTSTPESALAAMLCVFTGMSLAKGRAVAKSVGSMRALCASVQEDSAAAARSLRDTVCSGRRLGPVLSAKIVAALSG
jgi:ERCC4-type nuclease